MSSNQSEEERLVSDWLWEYGHFKNPKKKEALNVKTKTECRKLCCEDQEYIEAVQSIQELDYNLEELVRIQHGPNRVVQFDGEVGPATLGLLDLPRCGCPDYGTGLVQEETANADLPGSGGWPSCDPEQPHAHSFRVRIETGRMPAKFKAYLDEVLQYAFEACREIGLLVEFSVDPNEPRNSFQGYQYWGPIAGGVIGWNILPRPNTCNQTLEGKMDTAYVPDSAKQAARLQIHEMEGHGIGLGHFRGGVMNPSILFRPNDRPTYIGDPAFNTLKRMYGGEPVTRKRVFVDFW